ncbi:MAG: helix-turn-helix domain-containing protein [Oscillospiraceae bacterium]
MNVLEKIQLLCKGKGINPSNLEVELGFGKGTMYKWNKSSPNTDKLSAVADYFHVSIDWLLGKTEFRSIPDEETLASDVKRYEDFSRRDKKDIATTMSFILEQLDSHQEALMFDGEILDDNTRELLKSSLINSLQMGKIIAKQKFTPDKHKK